MKKILAILMSLMLMTCAFAAVAETVDTSAWNVIAMADVGLQMLRPDELAPIELTDEDYSNGIAYAAKSDTLSLVVYLWATDESTTLDAVEAEVATLEGYQYQRTSINGIEGVAFETTNDDGMVIDGVIVLGSDGYAYQFMFMPTDEESGALAVTIMNTLSPMAAE